MKTIASRYHWIFAYKLHHLPFWALYHYVWWSLGIGSAVEAANHILFSPYVVKFAFYVILQAMGVYFNLYFLIPRLLEKGKYVSYVALLLLTLLCTATLIVSGYYVSAELAGKSIMELYQVESDNWFYFFKTNTLPSTIASMTLAMSIKLTKNWIQANRRQQALEKEKLETELKFLRSQFNPHFLFNTINSIFFLIHKNPAEASESLAKFSDLLRYQLYECNEAQIPLDREIAYVENFIELEKLRQEANLKLEIELSIHSGAHFAIAPFILIPFIENAFKHVSRRNQGNWIRVKLTMENHQLSFFVSNSTEPDTIQADIGVQYGGIGLKNVRRRMELIYPDQHKLEVLESADSYSVSLSLSLTPIEILQEFSV